MNRVKTGNRKFVIKFTSTHLRFTAFTTRAHGIGVCFLLTHHELCIWH